MVEAVIFDMGGVVLESKVEEVYAALAKDLSVDCGKLTQIFKDHQGELLSGKMTAATFAELAGDVLQIENGRFVKQWKESYLGVRVVNQEVFGLVKRLKYDYQVALVSNVSDLHAEINRERGLYAHFNPAILSCQTGFYKPQKGIFEIALKRLELPADSCVLIDDRKEQLDVPAQMGFKTIWYQNAGQLMKDLELLGVKTQNL